MKVFDNISGNLRAAIMTAVIVAGYTSFAYAQADRKYIRQGNREYSKGKFQESELLYRRAIDKNKSSADAVFNAGDALYKQKKYDEAAKSFSDNYDMNEDSNKKAGSLYNLGNSLLMANKLQESIHAYKSSLKLDPGNMEAKYNLAYAQDLLFRQQQQQEQKQKQQDGNNQDKNKDNQDKNNGDERDHEKNGQQQQQQQGISREDAERLLNALANEEKNVQEKVKLAKAARENSRALKNW